MAHTSNLILVGAVVILLCCAFIPFAKSRGLKTRAIDTRIAMSFCALAGLGFLILGLIHVLS